MYKKPHKQRGKNTVGSSPGGMPEFLDSSTVCTQGTWRIIPVSKWLVTPIYKPFRPFVKGITLLRGLTITMVISHLLKWDDPPSIRVAIVLPLLLPTPARRGHIMPLHLEALGFKQTITRNSGIESWKESPWFFVGEITTQLNSGAPIFHCQPAMFFLFDPGVECSLVKCTQVIPCPGKGVHIPQPAS